MMKKPEAMEDGRLIGHLKGGNKGPTMVFFGGIHGNEPSGEKAIEIVFQKLKKEIMPLKGSIYGIRGNVMALKLGKRFLDHDLNRLWTEKRMEEIFNKSEDQLLREERELLAISHVLKTILDTEPGPFYFIDFHTTSSETPPFITINDALINRKFARLFPVPIVLGIEEYLEGPLLSYINQKGYLSVGFESGQHLAKEAVENSVAFMWLALVYGGALLKDSITDFEEYKTKLQESGGNDSNFYEIFYKHGLEKRDQFTMEPGFRSFDLVNKGSLLAQHNHESILAKKQARVFMPLYQKQGEDGFFLIRKIPSLALWLSAVLRKIKMSALLPLLPGLSWADKNKGILLVNKKAARFLAKPFFHLLGYRNRVLNKNEILMISREATAKNKMYQATWWY